MSWNRRKSAQKDRNDTISWGISTVFSTGVENSVDSPNEHCVKRDLSGGPTLSERRRL
jgi:hypothetical protein